MIPPTVGMANASSRHEQVSISRNKQLNEKSVLCLCVCTRVFLVVGRIYSTGHNSIVEVTILLQGLKKTGSTVW